jgi:hypothetical protein
LSIIITNSIYFLIFYILITKDKHITFKRSKYSL